MIGEFLVNDFIEKRDEKFWKELTQLVNENNLDIKFISENINSFTMRRHTNQTLAYYELFKKIVDVPGSILEFGVFYGNGLFTWLNLLETFIPTDRGRKVFGFDDMAGYDRELDTTDFMGVKYIENVRGDFSINKSTITKLVDLHNSDNLVPNDKRCLVIDGDVTNTFSIFRENNPGVRACLVNIDLNLYKPTEFVLNSAWQILVKGGLMVFRGYGNKPWEGESKAVDEFFANYNCKFETISFNNTPGCYVKKN